MLKVAVHGQQIPTRRCATTINVALPTPFGGAEYRRDEWIRLGESTNHLGSSSWLLSSTAMI
jgi:hypothetical protein